MSVDTQKSQGKSQDDTAVHSYWQSISSVRMISGDETHSMVSDSWSTDVVASDTETGEGMQAPGGIVPAGSLPDVVPGPPDLPRLDLIREESAQGEH